MILPGLGRLSDYLAELQENEGVEILGSCDRAARRDAGSTRVGCMDTTAAAPETRFPGLHEQTADDGRCAGVVHESVEDAARNSAPNPKRECHRNKWWIVSQTRVSV